MNGFDTWNWMTAAVLVLVAGLPLAAHLFSSESRERRQRRRSYRRVISRARRPVVMLSVRTLRR